ncbi:MAG: glycosyltransferase family 4 protein [Victivallaceae bacterium]|nr:glycosyltransferase family 4 protein [Victivallaceae bacterium]
MSGAIKVLFVSEVSGFAGGVERYLFHTAGLLRRNGFEVDGTFEKTARGSAVFEAEFDRVLPWGAPDALPGGYDLVMVHKLRSARYLEALECRFKVAVMVHDHEYFCPRFCKYFPFTRRNCHRRYRRWFCGVCGMLRGPEGKPPLELLKYRFIEFPRLAGAVLAADKLAVLSDFMAKELEKDGACRGKIKLVHPCVPVAAPAVPAAGEPPHIVCSGQLIRGKGFDLLLAALSELGGEWVADILGDGKDRELLKAQAAELGDRVRFHGWVSDPEKYYRAATLAVLPWRWQEPFGLVGPEALAYSLPLAGFAVGGFGEYLIDGITGIVVRPGEVRGLTVAMRELLDNPEKARRFGANGRRLVEDRFSEQRLVASFEALAREMNE